MRSPRRNDSRALSPCSPVAAPRRRRSLLEPLEGRRLLAFGLTTSATTFTVDTGGGVTFSVLRQGSSSTIKSGDLTSFKLNGVEFEAPYSATSRYSHFESGLSNSAVVTATVDPSGNWIKIACDDTTATVGAGATGVIQYYVAHKGDPNIYMATYAPEMLVSSTRFITYLDGTKFPYRPAESDNTGGTGAIESADVNGHADGTTTSKYYGETRNIDGTYHGASGPAAGAFMFIGNRESGSGGPFWKDIDFQSGPSAVELYTMPYSGHSLTDSFRPGLHGPFALNLTNGTPPEQLPDYTFLDGVGLTGWVSPSGRGTLSGHETGLAAGRTPTVALANAAAQYWATPDASGDYTITGIKPGTYTETLYDEELAVGVRTVTITAAQTTRANITATGMFALNGSNNTFTSYPAPGAITPIWRIGNWDGTPREFLNGDKTTIMHPQDSRMSPWAADSSGVTNFTVGVDKDSAFPMAEWKTQVGAAPYVDTKNRITFTLTAAQAAQAMTLRLGLTRLDSERPGVSFNGGTTTYSSTIISEPDTRGLSLGNWRGNNGIYSYSIAANALHAGTNTIDIYAIAGSTFTGYFAGYHIYDAIDLIPTASAAAPVTSLVITPSATAITAGATGLFNVIGNNSRAVNAVWTASRGIINDAGEYIAPATIGSDTITATVGTVTSSVTINVVTTAPTVATPATAAAPITYTGSTTLSALGADDNGEASLKYTWSMLSAPSGGTVTFGTNASNAAKNTSASFSKYGVYTLQVSIADASGSTTVSRVNVVSQNEKLWIKADLPNGAGLDDSSGNGTFASAYGRFDIAPGVSSGAIHFNGGAATLPSGIVAGLNDFTVSAWVKPDALNDWARIFDFGSSTTSYMFLAARTGTAGNPIRFAINAGSGEQVVNGPTLAAGVWTHLAVTLAGSTATLYVNGTAVATNNAFTLTPSSLGVTTNNFIGESQFAADPSYLGSIDDFRLYGRALSGTEISTLAKPTVAAVAAASPTTVTGKTATLSVLGADLTSGEPTLTYAWSAVGTPPAAVTFGAANGTNAGKTLLATFAKAGTYTLRATITNPGGNTVTSDVVVVVSQTLTGVVVSPDGTTLGTNATQQFTVAGVDQFGDAMATPPTATWSIVSGGGSISSTGLYTASGTTGSAVVRAAVGALSDTASITIVDTTAPQATGTFAWDPTQVIGLTFSEDVLASLDATDLTIANLTTGQTFDASGFAFQESNGAGGATVATWTRTGGILPDGNYRVTLPAGSVTDGASNSLAADYTFDFFVLAGDANHDRTVNFTDLLTLAKNYGQGGQTFATGDFNYDGKVDFSDLLILAKSYGQSLAAPAPEAAPLAATAQRKSAAVALLD